jgi:hypothetical protein
MTSQVLKSKPFWGGSALYELRRCFVLKIIEELKAIFILVTKTKRLKKKRDKRRDCLRKKIEECKKDLEKLKKKKQMKKEVITIIAVGLNCCKI